MAQPDELLKILSESPVFQDVPADQLAEIVALVHVQEYPAGSIVLKQGDMSSAVYFLLSGRLAIRVSRGGERETVAWMQPPDLFGELSFMTGRPCVADVEVVVDAKVACITRDSLPAHAPYYEQVLRGLARMIAGRLQATVAAGVKALPRPVVLLSPDRTWDAPQSFAGELAKSLQNETDSPTLLIEIGESGRGIEPLGDAARTALQARPEALRSTLAAGLTEWSEKFRNIILSPGRGVPAESIAEFANWHGLLLGPGSSPPPDAEVERFVVQSSQRPTLPVLDGRRQLIAETRESEEAYAAGKMVGRRFKRVVDSIARLIAGTQVGVALGGGAAWGWAHIGVLEVLENHGIPVDMLTGCSMGGVIGAFRASGRSIQDLLDIANYWNSRTTRFVEWKLWNLCLLNARMVQKVFVGYFGERAVNQTEIPYWANAVDIQSGTEHTLSDGPLWECVRSSIALPGLLPPLPRGRQLLLDASILDPVPVRMVRRMGAKFAIAINAMVPPEAQKMSARYPFNLFEIMSRCMFVMGHEIGEARAERNADVVFTPDLREISLLQFNRSAEIIAAGRLAAEQKMPAIKALYARHRSAVIG